MRRRVSIFDDDSPFSRLPWVQEKVLRALQDAARFVDLANEPDTTTWYARRLRELASPLVGHLAPLAALVFGAGAEAAASKAWEGIITGGTFALAAWAKRWKIVDPTAAAFAAFAPERDDAEIDEKAEAPADTVMSADEAHAAELKLAVLHCWVGHLLRTELADEERQLALWLMYHLPLSPYADVVVVSKRFLPTDIGLTPETTLAGYRALVRRGMIERVDELPDLSPESLALRLVAGDANASKHPRPYHDETFGFPGARVGGRPTIGNELGIPLPLPLAQAVLRWRFSNDDLDELRIELQRGLGDDLAYVERVEIERERDAGPLWVRLRYPIEEDDRRLVVDLQAIAQTWLRARLQVVGRQT